MAEEEKYILTPYGCKVGVLIDQGIDISHMTLKMEEHMVTDFQEEEEEHETD